MQHSEGVASLAPDQHQRVLSVRHLRESLLDILRRLYRLAIHRDDDVAGRNACVIGRAAGLHARDYCALYIAWRLQLVPNIGSEF